MRVGRRQFLHSIGSATAAGFFVGGSRQACAATAAIDRPVFATIGLRNQGWAITNKSFKFADFAALADVDAGVLGTVAEQTADKQSQKPVSYGDYRRIIERTDIDAVMIATPAHWHTKIAIEAMWVKPQSE